jgi:F-type H+-transporting ATPase subunit delta
MFGSSRESLAQAVGALDTYRQQPGFAGLADELFAVAGLLTDQNKLRSALADSGQLTQVRSALLSDVLAGKVSETAMTMLDGLVTSRWSTDADLVTAIEQLAAQASFTMAEEDGSLDAVEEEIFRFGRAVDSSADLQMALTNPSQPTATKAAIVRDLLGGRSTPATGRVLEYFASNLHGQRLDTVIDHLCDLAAQQRKRVVAEVRVAIPLTDDQKQRLVAALSAIKDRPVRLNVAVDPEVLGGIHVSIGDEVIDGSVAARLEQARRAVLG